MKKLLSVLFLLFIISLFGDNLKFRIIGSTETYATSYKRFHYDEPLVGAHLSAEIFNLVNNYGLGGSAFYNLKSFDDRFDSYKYYDIYLHNYYTYTNNKNYFIYGFFGGFRNTMMDYVHIDDGNAESLNMIRVILGFHYSTENWGMKTYWTQAENRKPVLGYEVKYRSSIGLVVHIGRTNRGPISKADSEFYLQLGYEFFR